MKQLLMLSAFLAVSVMAQPPITMAKVGSSPDPDSLALPVVFILGDKGSLESALGTDHFVRLAYDDFYENNGDHGGDTLRVTMTNLDITGFAPGEPIIANPRVFFYMNTGTMIGAYTVEQVTAMGGFSPGDTLLVSWNPAHPAAIESAALEPGNQSPVFFAAPNPFTTSTLVHLPAGTTGLDIFNANGQMIRRFSASGEIRWDRRNGFDCPVAPGVYYGRTVSSGKSVVLPLFVIK